MTCPTGRLPDFSRFPQNVNAPTAAPETQAAQAAFNAAFAADLARVKAGHDPKDALELAGRMLATAKETKTQVAFLTLLCEKAYELAVPYPSGHPTALEAMKLLASLVPEDFNARYFLFVSNSVGSRRISLFAIGERR